MICENNTRWKCCFWWSNHGELKTSPVLKNVLYLKRVHWFFASFLPKPQLTSFRNHRIRLIWLPFLRLSGLRNRNGPGFIPAKDCQLGRILPLQQQQQLIWIRATSGYSANSKGQCGANFWHNWGEKNRIEEVPGRDIGKRLRRLFRGL